MISSSTRLEAKYGLIKEGVFHVSPLYDDLAGFDGIDWHSSLNKRNHKMKMVENQRTLVLLMVYSIVL